jgi:hypothetical protein
MATWEYSSLKLTLVFVFQKIGRQVQGKLTRWKEYVHVERSKILGCFAPCLSLVFKIQNLVDFIFIDNASGQCKVPSGDLYEVLFVSSIVLQGITTCYTSSCFQLRFLTTITCCSSQFYKFTTCSIWLWKNGFYLCHACHLILFISQSFRSSFYKHGGPMSQLARTWHVKSINFSDTAKRYVSSSSME